MEVVSSSVAVPRCDASLVLSNSPDLGPPSGAGGAGRGAGPRGAQRAGCDSLESVVLECGASECGSLLGVSRQTRCTPGPWRGGLEVGRPSSKGSRVRLFAFQVRPVEPWSAWVRRVVRGRVRLVGRVRPVGPSWLVREPCCSPRATCATIYLT